MRKTVGGTSGYCMIDEQECEEWEYFRSNGTVCEAPSNGSKECTTDSDCVVVGEDGDCACGCYNVDSDPAIETGCFCAAPKSCKCVDNVCTGVFE